MLLVRTIFCLKQLYTVTSHAKRNHQLKCLLFDYTNYFTFDSSLNLIQNQTFRRKFSITSRNKNAESADSAHFNDVDRSKHHVLKEFKANRSSIAENYVEIKMYLIREFGMNPSCVANLAKDCPEIYSLEVEEVRIWIEMLLSYSFKRSQIMHLIINYSWLLLVPFQQTIDTLSNILERIHVTRLQLPVLCVNAPCVLADIDGAETTMAKFAYFYYEISYKDIASIVASGAFKFSLNYIKQRYVFLYRRGQYILPTRNELSQDQYNPSINDVCLTSDEDYCKNIAECELDEFNLFKKFFAAECNLREKILEDQNKIVLINGKKTPVDDLTSDDDDSEGLADELLKYL